jgi:hypothetical protein
VFIFLCSTITASTENHMKKEYIIRLSLVCLSSSINRLNFSLSHLCEYCLGIKKPADYAAGFFMVLKLFQLISSFLPCIMPSLNQVTCACSKCKAKCTIYGYVSISTVATGCPIKPVVTIKRNKTSLIARFVSLI